tara:strand:+ start:4488 stop:5510 length:1023 start_codon:yes stop_codon:yes gene_type:complete
MNKYVNKGITGLQNLGNTCFINSAIQCLFNVQELNLFMDKLEIKKLNNKPDSILLIEWNNLRELVFKDNCIISPVRFINTIRKISSIKDKDIFTGIAQNDLPEFLLFIIDCFHNSLAREVNMTIEGSIKNDKDKVAKECYKMMKNMYKNEFSEILTFFYGIHVSNIVSIQNNKILSSCPEPFMNISLSIPNVNNPNIYNCFDDYLKEEILKDDNAWFNDKTNSKENVIKKFRIWSLPKIMIIDFKRFTNNLDKDNRYITFPINNLDMRKYIDGYNSADYIYDLFGICNHLGGTKGGHYNSYVKNLNGKWYLYDDTEVIEITDVENLVSSNAYCLFYRKKT